MAEWVVLDECANEGIYCPNCSKKIYTLDFAKKVKCKFCPNCGTRIGKVNSMNDLISRTDLQNHIAEFLSLYLQDNVREAVEAIDEYIGDMPSAEIKPCTAEYQKVYRKGWDDGRRKMVEAMEREIAY